MRQPLGSRRQPRHATYAKNRKHRQDNRLLPSGRKRRILRREQTIYDHVHKHGGHLGNGHANHPGSKRFHNHCHRLKRFIQSKQRENQKSEIRNQKSNQTQYFIL